MRTRPTFECWQCERTFGQVFDLEGEPVLLLECPYCGAECKVDMAPYRERVVTVTRDEVAGTSAMSYEIPETVPTSKVGGEDPAQEA
ncbi:MAG: hypothetical protein LC667_06650 [Thioalkalivibrio sp.]|nr:hypothetical protein [Thioalkalivibrio sp.]